MFNLVLVSVILVGGGGVVAGQGVQFGNIKKNVHLVARGRD